METFGALPIMSLSYEYQQVGTPRCDLWKFSSSALNSQSDYPPALVAGNYHTKINAIITNHSYLFQSVVILFPAKVVRLEITGHHSWLGIRTGLID